MKVWVLAALLAALAMVPFVLQRGNINRLRSENARLQARVQELTEQLEKSATNRTQASKQENAGITRDQVNELMRLRREVTELRRLTNTAAGAVPARSATAAVPPPDATLAATSAPPPVLTTNGPPWNFKGYTRPEDTMSSMVWAMEQGRMDLLLGSATPEAQVQIQAEYGTIDKLQAQAREIVEVRPAANYPPTENEVYMAMVINRPEQQLIAEQKMDIGGRTVEKGQAYTLGAQSGEAIMKLQRVGNDWKFAGKVK